MNFGFSLGAISLMLFYYLLMARKVRFFLLSFLFQGESTVRNNSQELKSQKFISEIMTAKKVEK